eukprot:COSAG02_NODE_24324_length_691_cov_111.903716_1_plen_124_part_01
MRVRVRPYGAAPAAARWGSDGAYGSERAYYSAWSGLLVGVVSLLALYESDWLPLHTFLLLCYNDKNPRGYDTLNYMSLSNAVKLELAEAATLSNELPATSLSTTLQGDLGDSELVSKLSAALRG